MSSLAAPPWRALAVLAVLVLAAHTLVLRTTPNRFGPALNPSSPHAPAFVTRSIERPPAEVSAPPPALAPQVKPHVKPHVKPVKNPAFKEKEAAAQEEPAQSAIDLIASPAPQPAASNPEAPAATASEPAQATAPTAAASAPDTSGRPQPDARDGHGFARKRPA
ncbi:hypothetical protein LP414_18555 [Polaromonas sp. P1(28)-13]|nr:hypothetical protein LP414_18555 [Polaromonas sp. P1(28)-13]